MRGNHKLFLGMAAGVGKTYRMLQEGQAALAAGRDVAIGLLETHGREETAAQAEGLDVIPRRTVEHRGTRLEEMDLPAVLARAPDLCLVDEIAHTNAPGIEHDKRYEDVDRILDAGVDVFSTLNIQHVESLNDQITELTGVRTRETIPDEVLSRADELVLVDVTPETLLDRLRAGKVYAEDRVPAALNNFFRIEHLSALREVALREVAEEVELKRLPAVGSAESRPAQSREERLVTSAAPRAYAEQLLAILTLDAGSQRVLRRAWRSAERLGADLDVLVVRPPGRDASADEREALEGLRRLGAMLGTTLIVEEADDPADVAIRVARARRTTYILIGTPEARRGLGRLREPLAMRLVRALPGVDVRLVSDRAQGAERS